MTFMFIDLRPTCLHTKNDAHVYLKLKENDVFHHQLRLFDNSHAWTYTCKVATSPNTFAHKISPIPITLIFGKNV